MREKLKNDVIQSVICMDNLDTIVNKISLYLNNPIVIIDRTYNILSYSNTYQVDDDIWQLAVTRSYITLEFATMLNNWDKHCEGSLPIKYIITDKINKTRRKFYQLIIKGQLLGYINISEFNQNFELTNEEDYIFATQLLAHRLQVTIKQNVSDFKNNNPNDYSQDILLNLINKTYKNEPNFYENLKLSGLSIQTNYFIVCIDVSTYYSYNAKEDTFKNELLSFFPYSVIVLTDHILTILVKKQYFLPTSDNLLKLNEYLIKHNLNIGISDDFKDLYNLNKFRDQAINAYNLKDYVTSNKNNYVYYDNVKQIDLLRKIPKNELLSYCNQKILQIHEFDKTNNTDYIKTLNIYLETNHSVNETAKLLYIHRNTVNYRISKIKTLFEINIDDNFQTSQYLFSCKILIVLLNSIE